MKIVRFSLALAILAAFVSVGVLCIKQRTQIRSIEASKRSLAIQHEELSAHYAALLAIDEARSAEIVRLRGESAETLRLRNQVAQLRRQQAAAATESPASKPETPNDLAGYITKEQLRFAGFGSPESALQSMRWASMNGDYTNWMATLAPRLQEEELANTNSIQEFQRASAADARIKGLQVLARKVLADGKIELEVRLDSENSVSLLVFPMVTIGNEWRLGDEIHAYTEAWDQDKSAAKAISR
jgi:hypothetical protein